MNTDDSTSDAASRKEARRIREAILEGYRDAILGRTVIYQGNLRQLLERSAEKG